MNRPTGEISADGLTVESPRQPRPDGEGELLPGTRVADRYRIVSLLGRGGMGEVFRADDLKLGQAVALKFLPVRLQPKPEYLERLLDETKLARQVAHPNVCRVYDIGEWHGRHFLTMEYIDGEDLASLIKRIGHLPRQKALDIARQLCGGLDAAHQLGILHRDLKPANVMLDGRGRVRVTDFGLAVATPEVSGAEAAAGTPAYMAPEQLEGRRATVLSDIYALGLVLYELFTGRRPYPSRSLDELRRMHDESSPTRPSLIVEDIDPVVERAILRCLERDPALRPRSVRDVVALLPGGDPIAAALAAGETPSPDLIAVSGPDGVVRPAVAFGVLAGMFVMLIVLLLLADRAMLHGHVNWPRSVAALQDHARGILERLGHGRDRVDDFHRLEVNDQWSNYVARSDRSPDRWQRLREAGQWGFLYFYRESPRVLVPVNRHGTVTAVDPPSRAGAAIVLTDLRGRLISMEVQPEAAAPPIEVRAEPDWTALFREAGLDPDRFQPVAPTRNPDLSFDTRAAWSGVLPDFSNYPVRVEAAAYRGKPVFFELVVPWDSYWNPEPIRPQPARSTLVGVGYLLMVLLAVGTAVVLAIRSWATGRGDRHGALRLAVGVLSLRFLAWILGDHHVPVPATEWILLLTALGTSMTDAVFAWAFYLALEPYARRMHPRLLVSWTRLMRGRFRDPLVGRNILYGAAAATLLIFFWGELFVILPAAMGLPAPPRPMVNIVVAFPFLSVFHGGQLEMDAFLGGRHMLAALPSTAVKTVGGAFMIFMVFLALQLILRRRWAAAAATFVFLTAMGWPSEFSSYQPIGIACTAAGAAVILWTFRAGLVGSLTLFFCASLWLGFPITANLAAPHFATGLVGVLLIAAVGTYGAIIASRPMFATALRPDLGGQRA